MFVRLCGACSAKNCKPVLSAIVSAVVIVCFFKCVACTATIWRLIPCSASEITVAANAAAPLPHLYNEPSECNWMYTPGWVIMLRISGWTHFQSLQCVADTLAQKSASLFQHRGLHWTSGFIRHKGYQPSFKTLCMRSTVEYISSKLCGVRYWACPFRTLARNWESMIIWVWGMPLCQFLSWGWTEGKYDSRIWVVMEVGLG